MEETKKIINMIISQFQQAEVGNKVTENNMMGLQMKIMMALDGKLKLADRPEDPDSKE